MKKIKVYHIITRLIIGGAQQNTIETCDYIKHERYEPHIVLGPETGPEGELISDAENRRIPMTILPELLRAPRPVKDSIALIKMVALFRREKPQIVHTHSSKAGILGRVAAKIARVPIIIHTVHGWGHPVFSSKIKRAIFKFLERVCEPFTDKLIVVSSLNADKGLQDGIGTPDKYTTIHSCINIDDFSRPQQDISALKAKLGLRPDALVVGTVGRLSPQKNPADFVRVAARVKRDIPRAQFIFVGDGPLRPETEALIRQHNLEKDVLLPGLSSEVPDLLHCMDLFMLTSLWEGLPRVIPQAMAAGLPVVANGVDGVCEVIKDGTNGFFLRPHDIEGMSQKIIRLLSDPELYRSVADQGLRTAREEFSVWNMINQIETVYEHFLAARAPRA